MEVEEWLKNKYEDFYIDFEGKYLESCIEKGKLAMRMLATERAWDMYKTKYEFMELFKRCILYDFKNSKEVKKYMRN